MVYHLKMARDFEDEGDMDAAVKQAELAMEANPNSSRAMRDLGYYYFKDNNLKMAEKWLLKVAEKNDLDVFSFHYLGELYLKQNDIEKAQHYFEKAMKISPRHLDRGIKFAKILVQMKMITRANQVFGQVLKLSGNSVELSEEIADFSIEEGAYEYAVELLKSILKERPDREDLYFKLGKTLEKKGDIMEAVGYLVKAEKVDEENDEIKIHLAKNYLALAKPDFAEKALKKILKINPDNSLARDLLRKCA
jgi:tetratricopeptide (TPR) repeat protein